jgi:transposase
MSIDGYIACNLYRGAIDSERYEDFIRNDVLPQCTPFPGPQSVLVMDNASIHHGEVQIFYAIDANVKEIRDIIENAGCKLEYLPPYSPDYNPIEYSFSVVKQALKSSHQLSSDDSTDEMARKVKEAVKTRVTPAIARNQFHHCRIKL